MAITEHRMRKRLFPRLAVFVVCLLAGLSSTYAQSGKVILPLREMTLRQALNELQRQTNYKVAVNWDDLDPGRKVFFPSQETDASKLLQTSLSGTNFTWEVSGSQIIITYMAPDDGRGAHSVMTVCDNFRREAMTFVPDPQSRTQRPFQDMFNVRRSYWNPDGGKDSIGMAIVNYRIGSSTLERDYMDNARTLEDIRRSLTSKDVLAGLDYIVVTSASSPDGNTAANERLAVARSLAMKSYLMRQYPYLNRDMIYTFSVGEDWSGLRKMVEENRYTPYRDEVLSVLDTPIGNDAKRAALKSIGGGQAYRYMAANMLPKLRGAAAVTLHFKERSVIREVVVETQIVETHSVDTVYVEKTVEVEKLVEKERIILRVTEYEQHPLFALKTNLLFDVASAINAEIEIPIGRRWSVAGEWIFPWWLYEQKQYALQAGNGNLEVKHWFGDHTDRTRLTGWFMGLYGGVGYYDLEWKDRGWQGEFLQLGLSAGYAHTISRNGNWRMEYTLGIGYMGTDYRKYASKKGEDDQWHLMRRSRGHREWIGPTRAKISLVWMIHHGQRQKGGGAK